MRVIASARGFFGKLIEEGEEFEVPKDAKGSWFKPVKGKQSNQDDSKPDESNSEQTSGE